MKFFGNFDWLLLTNYGCTSVKTFRIVKAQEETISFHWGTTLSPSLSSPPSTPIPLYLECFIPELWDGVCQLQLHITKWGHSYILFASKCHRERSLLHNLRTLLLLIYHVNTVWNWELELLSNFHWKNKQCDCCWLEWISCKSMRLYISDTRLLWVRS